MALTSATSPRRFMHVDIVDIPWRQSSIVQGVLHDVSCPEPLGMRRSNMMRVSRHATTNHFTIDFRTPSSSMLRSSRIIPPPPSPKTKPFAWRQTAETPFPAHRFVWTASALNPPMPPQPLQSPVTTTSALPKRMVLNASISACVELAHAETVA